MEEDILKTNLLSIAVAGLLLCGTGLLLYFLRDYVSGYSRFVMPIPPLAVAAYIFVFNMYQHYGGDLPVHGWDTLKEILLSTAVAAVIFGVFTILLVFAINAIRG